MAAFEERTENRWNSFSIQDLIELFAKRITLVPTRWQLIVVEMQRAASVGVQSKRERKSHRERATSRTARVLSVEEDRIENQNQGQFIID